ncbi:calcium-binding protein [Psychromonas sp. RZ22]|uniref:calcium-binding protein n=1 Tax=Psychromonas algarum TaxID=2555643 RepID=UPI001067C6DC|nr:calcium-binding protein [Psychromonas sp. RZ22]TEW56154.1 calcium-binding protein [Psychromonas sp. RZ22]
MYSIKVGSTNLDGTGKNLTSDHEVLSDTLNTTLGNMYVSSTRISATSPSWNAQDSKEIHVETTNKSVVLNDYVDVGVDLQGSTNDVNVIINNAKRGDIITGEGNDRINVDVMSNGSNWSNHFDLDTGAGDDRITFTNSEGSEFTSVNIDAGTGNDFISILGLNAGIDTERYIDAGDGNDTVVGSESSDALYGGNGADTIYSHGGNDYIHGGHGNDKIYGGDGNDMINGGHGKDFIYGGNGNDTIQGEGGADYIFAGAGNDQVFFDSNDKVISGGEGFDSLVISGSANVVKAVGFEAIISNINNHSEDDITASLQDGLIVMLGGDAGDSVMFGAEVTFTAVASSFDDYLTMTAGTDKADIFELIDGQGYGISHIEALNGYQANTGEVIWSDVDLLTA